MTSSNALRNPNSYRHKDGEQGFSLVELSVALAIIAAGVVGTLSLIGSNRALMENAWLQKRLTLVANGIASEIVARHARGDAMSPVASYSWSTDAFALSPLFSDNQLRRRCQPIDRNIQRPRYQLSCDDPCGLGRWAGADAGASALCGVKIALAYAG